MEYPDDSSNAELSGSGRWRAIKRHMLIIGSGSSDGFFHLFIRLFPEKGWLGIFPNSLA